MEFDKNFKIFPTKSLGQNFLINKGIVAKIVAAAELTDKDTVLEIGPGKGVLTEELTKYAGRVVAVEKDKRLYEMLREKFKSAGNLELVNADILKITNYELRITNKYKIVANIPYNITGQFFYKFLTNPPQPSFSKGGSSSLYKREVRRDFRPQMIVVMVQKEVGERLLGKDKSILSLAAALYGTAKKVCNVSPGSFSPPPKIMSSVIKMVAGSSPRRGSSSDFPLRPAPRSFSEVGRRGTEGDLFINPPQPSLSEGGSEERDFEMEKKVMRLAKIGFSSRRKKLVSNLSTGLGVSKENLRKIFNEAGFNKNVRAEELSKNDWLKLAENL